LVLAEKSCLTFIAYRDLAGLMFQLSGHRSVLGDRQTIDLSKEERAKISAAIQGYVEGLKSNDGSSSKIPADDDKWEETLHIFLDKGLIVF